MSRVFVSSTFRGMEEYRRAAEDVITLARHEAVLLEFRGGSPEAPEVYCTREVERCDLFVLILGPLYGSTSEEHVSYTEYEHQAALERGLTRMVFVSGATRDKELEYTVLQRWAFSSEQPPLGSVDWQIKQQVMFRRSALRGVTPYTFQDPSDFKLKLLQALYEYLPQSADQLPAASPALPGEFLMHLCNRSDQLMQFGEQFDYLHQKAMRRPQIYALFGVQSQKHEACVERLLCYHIKRRFKNASQPPIAPAKDQRVVGWPGQDSDLVRFNRLRRMVFNALDPLTPVPTDYGIDDFWTRALALKARYVVLLHVLYADAFVASESLIRSHYLPFWDDVDRHPLSPGADPPQFLIFINVKYEAGSRWSGEALQARLHSMFGSIERAAEFSSAGAVTCLLPELRDVEASHIEQWLTTYNDYFPAHMRDRLASELFPPPPLPMHAVEMRIRDLLGLRSHGY